jgi:hypothetical protein
MTKTRKTRKTKTRGKGTYLRGWAKHKPNARQRTTMLRKCGKKCFLGPKKTFPICTKNTCKINTKGIHAAYSRAKEYVTIKGTRKYKKIAKKAYNMLYK